MLFTEQRKNSKKEIDTNTENRYKNMTDQEKQAKKELKKILQEIKGLQR